MRERQEDCEFEARPGKGSENLSQNQNITKKGSGCDPSGKALT
jgi:hypothetical protein